MKPIEPIGIVLPDNELIATGILETESKIRPPLGRFHWLPPASARPESDHRIQSQKKKKKNDRRIEMKHKHI